MAKRWFNGFCALSALEIYCVRVEMKSNLDGFISVSYLCVSIKYNNVIGHFAFMYDADQQHLPGPGMGRLPELVHS